MSARTSLKGTHSSTRCYEASTAARIMRMPMRRNLPVLHEAGKQGVAISRRVVPGITTPLSGVTKHANAVISAG